MDKLVVRTFKQSKGFGNNSSVKNSGGYSFFSREDIADGIKLFALYIKYVAEALQTDTANNIFIYEGSNSFLWENINIQRKTFTNNLNKLEKLDVLNRVEGVKKKVVYTIKLQEDEHFKLPLGIILNKKLTWDQKTLLSKIYVGCTDNKTYILKLGNSNMKNEIGLTTKPVTNLVNTLNAKGLVYVQDNAYQLDFAYLLDNINNDTTRSLQKENYDLRQALKDAGIEFKKKKPSIENL